MGNRKSVTRLALGALVLMASSALGASGGAATPANALSGRILITGSSTMAPLMSAIAQRFHSLHPKVSIDVQAGGSGRGLLDARQGKADVGMVSRALNETEKDLYGLPIARDGVAVVLHKDNPVRMLADQEIIDIYGGKVVNWKALGGRDLPILTVKAEAGRSSSELFAQYLGVRFDELKAQRIVGDNQARVNLMIQHPNAIVYMSVGEAERNALAGVPIKALPIGGVGATSANIRNGEFPISRALTLVTKGVPGGLAKIFIEYASSSQVTDLIVVHDFVPYLD